MKRYIIRDKEAGNVITWCAKKEDAEALVADYEKQDKHAGIFVPDFYEIVEKESKFVVVVNICLCDEHDVEVDRLFFEDRKEAAEYANAINNGTNKFYSGMDCWAELKEI